MSPVKKRMIVPGRVKKGRKRRSFPLPDMDRERRKFLMKNGWMESLHEGWRNVDLGISHVCISRALQLCYDLQTLRIPSGKDAEPLGVRCSCGGTICKKENGNDQACEVE